MAQIIDGKAVAARIRTEVAEGVRDLAARAGRPPGLAVVRVGDDPGSVIYVRNKIKAAQEVGVASFDHILPEATPEAELLALVRRLGEDARIDGILVQLPLPKHIDPEKVLELIPPGKDVDGFTARSAGALATGRRGLRACTPMGCLRLLDESKTQLEGTRALVVGRSNIVGKPMANLLIQQGPGGDATVTVCHSRTRGLPSVTRLADILIAAIGKPEFVTADMVRPGAVVIDVGINRVDDASRPRGYRLVGDVAYDSVAQIASAITPVPGGVGPMTIAMLLQNTLQAMQQADLD
jgi:methylenetetrahydrofolate dehydrogenase (NADP+) / methenyltetrahydrofolate cyclohydrolase